MSRSTRSSLGPLLAALLFCVTRGGQAEPVDAALPIVVIVGAPATPAPLDRLDRSRSGLSTVQLPSQLSEAQRRTVGSIGHAPVVHPNGQISVALTSPEIVRLAPDGTEIGRVQLGSSAAVRAPVVLPNGGLAVLTAAPSVVFVSESGRILSTVPLPRAAFTVQASSMGLTEGLAAIVPTEDGAVVVAANRSLLELDASSRVRVKVTLPERLASDPIPHPDGWLVVGESGGVHRVHPPAEPRKIGSLAGIVPGSAVLVDERTLVAQAPPNRLVELDLKTGASVTRVGDSIFAGFDAPPAFDARGAAWVTTIEGFLVGYDAAGLEIARAPAERTASLPGTLLSLGRPMHAPSNPVGRISAIVDSAGRVAFARPNGRFGIRNPDGKIVVTDRGCGTPAAIVPTGQGTALLACRDGTLIFYQQDAPADE